MVCVRTNLALPHVALVSLGLFIKYGGTLTHLFADLAQP